MPISNRPNLEAFINKGGSSSALLEETPKTAAKPARKKADAPAAAAARPAPAAPKAAIAPAPLPSPDRRMKGRPRKVVLADDLKFVMRIPPQISEDMTAVIESRKVPMSRNAWILEAIVEKLEREGKG